MSKSSMMEREGWTNGRSGTLIEPFDFIVRTELVGTGKSDKNQLSEVQVATLSYSIG